MRGWSMLNRMPVWVPDLYYQVRRNDTGGRGRFETCPYPRYTSLIVPGVLGFAKGAVSLFVKLVRPSGVYVEVLGD